MFRGRALERDGWDAPWRLPDVGQHPEDMGLRLGNGGFFGAARITAKGRRAVAREVGNVDGEKV